LGDKLSTNFTVEKKFRQWLQSNFI